MPWRGRKEKGEVREATTEQQLSESTGVVFPTAPPLGAAASLSILRGSERPPRRENLRPASVLRGNCNSVCNKLLCYLAK